MQIGLISDIHGADDRLRVTLALFDSLGIATILCAGDLVNGMGDADEVIALVQAREIPCVLGNHDRDAPGNDAAMRAEYGTDDPLVARWLIAPETITFLEALPRTRTLDLAGRSILLTHGTPDARMAYLFPDSDPAEYRALLALHPVDLVICGHTHMPMHVQIGEAHVVNPGSIYKNRFEYRGSRTCGVFDLAEMTLQVLDLHTGAPADYARVILPPE